MSVPVNTHEIEGSVNAKFGPFPVGNKGVSKNYLFVDCAYMIRGKITTHTIKALCFSWGDNASKISKLLPGDYVKFSYYINGRVNYEKKDFLGVPSLWNEIIIDSDVEILNTSQRRLYDNGIETKKDDLGTFDTPKVKLGDPDADDPANDLPF
jgi:hypothetical protein